jgi:hypothetical protein
MVRKDRPFQGNPKVAPGKVIGMEEKVICGCVEMLECLGLRC